MRKSGRKRGRPPLGSHVDAILLRTVCEERAKPPAERTQVNILAYNVREEIIRTSGKDKRPPALSTLKKRISKLRSTVSSLEDKPWSVFTLGHCPIPPEAVPIVLKEYGRLLSSQRFPPPHITIRQAKWIGRLSATKAFERWPDLYLLASLAEQVLEWLCREPPLSAEQVLRELAERPRFALVDQALAKMEAGDTDSALIIYDACKSWIYRGYDRMPADGAKRGAEQ